MSAAAQLRLGLDLGGTKLAGVVMAPDGEVVAARRVPSPRDDYGATLQSIVDLIDRLQGDVGASGVDLKVGIGTPGSWQPDNRTMKNCNSVWLNGQPLLDDLVARLGPRVRIANDANCFALSEARDGAGLGSHSVFGVILGTGVGGGLVVNGSLLSGASGAAGEWGHMPLPYFLQRAFLADAEGSLLSDAEGSLFSDAEGSLAGTAPGRRNATVFQLESRLSHRACYCGRLNCIETFLSGPGLAETHRALWHESRSPEEIGRTDREPERHTLALYANMLTRSLAQVVNLFDPQTIVLGGGVSNIGNLYGFIKSDLPRYLFSYQSEGVEQPAGTAVEPARWGDDSGVRGAAQLWGRDE